MSIVVNNSMKGPAVNPTPQPASPPGSPAPRARAERSEAAILDEQLQEALQKTSIKTEIEYKADGLMVFRFVDEDTRHVEFQMPTETILSLIESLNEAAKNRDVVPPGAFIDQQA